MTVSWTLIHVGNYEHVKALGAPLQFTYAQYMRDGVFVAGSAVSVSHLGWVIILLTIGAGLSLLGLRRTRGALSWQNRLISLLALAFANVAWPSDYGALAWRERNFIELLVVPRHGKVTGSPQRTPLPPAFRANIAGDLNGKPLLSLGNGQPNVLLVILEGITGGSIPSVASAHDIKYKTDMPELSAVAERSMSFSTFITNQRQTNRGEFALLCGQLDYLLSGTSRMTEYARSGGEPCLPSILADQGYQTMYVQSAPLSFMMKDQFMVKAGFTDVRGHDAFPFAYARSNWGVDDRAFFERSLEFIKELDASKSPWFAALLTVGTHHPYTVPEDFRTGTSIDEDMHGRAVRYLDQAVGAFVAQLEASHILDDTLLLITSDESFGVEGYDDLTQLLSYNWGFLIAKAPGDGKRVVAQPYAQTDVALSVADYLGLGTGPLVGRSLFREYEDERRIVFANTYQQKVYWAAPPAIVECDEGLSMCQKHTGTGPGMFSANRATTAADEIDVAPLREMIALTTSRESPSAMGRTPLVLENAAVWDMGVEDHGLVFGGQYFSLGADQEVVVSLDVRVSGVGSSVLLDADLFARGMLYEVFPPSLHDGDRLQFEYLYAPGKDLANVEVRLNATKQNPGDVRLIIKEADLVVRPRTLQGTEGTTTKFELERARPQETYYLGSGTAAAGSKQMFATHPCVTRRNGRELIAKACHPGILVFGPYAKVPAGSDVRVTLEVISESGDAQLRGEIVAALGSKMFAQSEVSEIKGESGTMIVMTAHLDDAVDGLEARLALLAADAEAVLVLRRGVMEIFPSNGTSGQLQPGH